MNQEVLISTVHNEDNVVEVYLNPIDRIVSELIFSIRDKTQVFQTDLDSYLDKDSGYKGVDIQIINFLD